MNLDYLLFSEKDILERVDEYTLYCFYLGYEPLIGGKYSAPYREDKDPSWGMFEGTKAKVEVFHEFMWKDGSTGETGNIFHLVKKLFGYGTQREAMMKVCADFGLGGTNKDNPIMLTRVKHYADPVDIAVASKPFSDKDLRWWQQFNISFDLLQYYTTSAIKCYWVAKEQTIPSYPKGLGYAYREYDKYQLYFPIAADKKDKFRTNFTKELHVHGYRQLQSGDLGIITKSRKDVMCLRSFGYNAISPMSENTLVPDICLDAFRKRYPRTVVLFDNDLRHRGDEYIDPKVYVPTNLREDDKDVSDYCKHHGPVKTAEMLKQILQL